MTPENLLSKIEAYAEERGLSPATVTSRAVGNSRLYSRMKRGGGCNIRIANRLLAYMAENAFHQSSPSPSPENAGGV